MTPSSATDAVETTSSSSSQPCKKQCVRPCRSLEPIALGSTLPPQEIHAVSVSLPTWDDVVGYEEHTKRVRDALQGGYPRFVAHPLVCRLQTLLEDKLAHLVGNNNEHKTKSLLVMPTTGAAERLKTFLEQCKQEKDEILVQKVDGDLHLWVVVFPMELATEAYRFWQHGGEIVTSRHAEAALKALEAASEDITPTTLQVRGTESHSKLQTRIAELYFPAKEVETCSKQVFVYPTGMAAVGAVMRALTEQAPTDKAIVLGYPYVDSRRQHELPFWCPSNSYFIPVFNNAEVEVILKRERIRSIFVEFPGNPLMTLPDLEKLAALAHKYETCLVVDDTVASYNVNVMQFETADIVVTSLTKIFCGTGTAMGGSVVLNPTSVWSSKLAPTFKAEHFILEADAEVLLNNSEDVVSRIERTNTAAHTVAERLSKHAQIRNVFYPSLDVNRARMEQYWRQDDGAPSECKGYGPLISFVLHGGEQAARAFYDNLTCAKGPSLGTNFTLCCPYSLLVHYTEGDEAERAGIDRHLIRISIGLEDIDAIWNSFETAFAAAQLVASPKSGSNKRKREDDDSPSASSM